MIVTKYIKDVILGDEGDEDSTAALTPQQVAEKLILMDPDDLIDLQFAIDRAAKLH